MMRLLPGDLQLHGKSWPGPRAASKRINLGPSWGILKALRLLAASLLLCVPRKAEFGCDGRNDSQGQTESLEVATLEIITLYHMIRT